MHGLCPRARDVILVYIARPHLLSVLFQILTYFPALKIFRLKWQQSSTSGCQAYLQLGGAWLLVLREQFASKSLWVCGHKAAEDRGLLGRLPGGR